MYADTARRAAASTTRASASGRGFARTLSFGKHSPVRTLLSILAALVVSVAYMALQTQREPLVRTLHHRVAQWPTGTKPFRIALLADIHVSGPDMPPSRLAEIAIRVNAEKPDLILLGGDYNTRGKLFARTYSFADAIGPLAKLRARLGTIAVLGNHDHWGDISELRVQLAKANITVLQNEAVRRGPLVIGGVDDDFTRSSDVPSVVTAIKALGGVPVIVSHSPDIFPLVPDSVSLTLTGHTHCGQISPPLIGPVLTGSRFGRDYLCGVIRRGKRTLLVSAGLGTSILPLRLGTRSEIWIVEIGPA